MRRLLSMTLTMLGLVGLVTPDSLASSFVWRSIDRYANQRKIPQGVQDKIVKADLSKRDNSVCKCRMTAPLDD